MKLINFVTILLIIIFKFTALHAEVPDPEFKQKAASPTHTDISGIEFNNDGTKVFYTGFQTSTKVLGYSLSTAWDISTINSSSEEELDLDAGSDDVGNNVEGIEFNADGTKIFATDYQGKMNAHTLSTPFDLTTATQVADDGVSDWRTYLHGLGRSVRSHDITFNSDGTKMFLVDVVRTQVTVVEYNLSTAYDTSTATHNQNTDLTSLTSFLLVQQAMKFDDDGTRMYIINAGTSANNKFYVLSSTASEIRDLDWFNHNINKDEKVEIKNITEDYGVLVLVGPKSRNVLSQLTSESLDNKNFPWLKGKEIEINKISVRALRINYMGELGWELHHPMKQMASLYDAIYEVGKKEKINNFGTYAVNSLRMEKAYRGWGAELTGEISLVEAGMNRFFNLDKKNKFIGSDVLRKKLQSGVDIKIAYLEIDVDDADARGNEPVYHNNKIVGVVTSGAYGFRVKKSLAFAYVNSDLVNEGTEFLIGIQGKKRKAKVVSSPLYDPENKKLKT